MPARFKLKIVVVLVFVKEKYKIYIEQCGFGNNTKDCIDVYIRVI